VSLSLAPAASGQETDAAEASIAGAGDSSLEAEVAPADAAPVEAEAPLDVQLAYSINNMILFVCAVLVIFMQAGFAMLEAGLNAAKNTVNILFKNLMDLSIGVLLFFIVGYGLMYNGAEVMGGWFRIPELFVSSEAPALEAGALHPQVDFLFQVAFAATAATIVSGAVAGRMKFGAYLVYSAVLTAFIYPVSGMWKWGGGVLDQWGFHDFAGSIVVHAVGGFAGWRGRWCSGRGSAASSAANRSPCPAIT
jgi:ammonium transporter, Amt family